MCLCYMTDMAPPSTSTTRKPLTSTPALGIISGNSQSDWHPDTHNRHGHRTSSVHSTSASTTTSSPAPTTTTDAGNVPKRSFAINYCRYIVTIISSSIIKMC